MDARPLGREPTGVGRYLEALLTSWLELFPEDAFLLVSPRPIALPASLKARVETKAGPTRVPGTVWLQTLAPFLAERGGAGLFFGPLGILPLRMKLPGVATVHDLTPMLHPAWHDLKNRVGFAFLGPTVQRARRLITVSEATRRDLVRAFPAAERKSVVVHHGVTIPPRSGDGPPPNEGRPYVLYLGTLEPRKNLGRLVEAMERLWDRRPDFPDLLLAGGKGWSMKGFAERLERSRHAARIRRTGYVAAGEAAALLRGARLLAYPSLYEGFGLPPLEAMALGTVVVGSSSSSLPEVIGDAGLLPDPQSVPAIEAALEKANDDEAWRHQARVRGLARAARFTWEEAVRRTRAVFEEALA